MKRIFYGSIAIILILTFSACGRELTTSQQTIPPLPTDGSVRKECLSGWQIQQFLTQMGIACQCISPDGHGHGYFVACPKN